MTKREDRMKKFLKELDNLKNFLQNSALSKENILGFCEPKGNDKDFQSFLKKFEDVVEDLRKSVTKARRSI